MNAQELQELRFVDSIRAALNESASMVDPAVAARLAASRRIALSRKKAESEQTVPVLAGASGSPSSWGRHETPGRFAGFMRRFGLLVILVAIAAAVAGVYEVQQEERLDELADVDAAMLLDDLPPSAYADHGFHLFLKRNP